MRACDLDLDLLPQVRIWSKGRKERIVPLWPGTAGPPARVDRGARDRQQITEAFPGDTEIPRFLHRDRDSVYGDAFRRRVAALGLREVVSAKQAPWQNPFCERAVGSIRRECTDHVIALGEHHLRRTLRAYAAYYNGSRCHMSLEGNAPEPREVEHGRGPVLSVAHLGGLHHRYTRQA